MHKSPSRNIISLDFEIELGTVLDMTPDLLLMRSGIHLGSSCSGENLQFPNVTSTGLWSVGIDGVEQQGRQQLQARLEATTEPLRPKEILNSGILDEMSNFFHQMKPEPHGHVAVPLSKGLYYTKSHPLFVPQCTRCHLQYTVGIDLRNVPQLLSLTQKKTSFALQMVLNNVRHLCANRRGGCSKDYMGLLTLVSWVLAKGHHCTPCWTPKLCMIPWLVRTHFGDMARFVAEEHGEEALATFPEDVLAITKLPGDGSAHITPYREYLQFQEFAELANGNRDQGKIHEMVKTKEGLCKLATSMVQPSMRKTLDQDLLNRPCGLKGLEEANSKAFQNTLTAKEWLQEIVKGRDLLSDVDSPISAKASSHLVWKSMGAWRMGPKTRGIVYIECRIANKCLEATPSAAGPIDMIHRVTKEFLAHEQAWFPREEVEVPRANELPEENEKHESAKQEIVKKLLSTDVNKEHEVELVKKELKVESSTNLTWRGKALKKLASDEPSRKSPKDAEKPPVTMPSHKLPERTKDPLVDTLSPKKLEPVKIPSAVKKPSVDMSSPKKEASADVLHAKKLEPAKKPRVNVKDPEPAKTRSVQEASSKTLKVPSLDVNIQPHKMPSRLRSNSNTDDTLEVAPAAEESQDHDDILHSDVKKGPQPLASNPQRPRQPPLVSDHHPTGAVVSDAHVPSPVAGSKQDAKKSSDAWQLHWLNKVWMLPMFTIFAMVLVVAVFASLKLYGYGLQDVKRNQQRHENQE